MVSGGTRHTIKRELKSKVYKIGGNRVKQLLSAKEVFLEVERKGIEKSQKPNFALIMLGFLAGMFIALAGITYVTVVSYGNGIDSNTAKFFNIIGAMIFPVGIVLITFTGAELFTGNNIMTVGGFRKTIKWKHVFRNWGLVLLGNLLGSLFIMYIAYLSGVLENSAFESTIEEIAIRKTTTNLTSLFFKALLCNMLVVLAVWMSYAAKDTIGKVILLWFPITAFVLSGFEHSIANMLFIPLGMISNDSVTLGHFINNIVVVTVGNAIGGAIIIPGIFFLTYKSEEKLKNSVEKTIDNKTTLDND